MQLFCTSVAFLGFLAQWVSSETIIGYDGKELHWHPHRDGFHDRALHEHARHRRHDLSHPRLRRFDTRQLPHMLNQKAPIIVSQHNLRIATHSHRTRSFGVDAAAQKTLAAAIGNATKEESAMGLNRMEKDMMDSVFEDAAGEGKHAAKRDQSFHFRAGHKQSEQHAAEDLTAQEVERERMRRMRKFKSRSRARVGAAPASASPAASSPAGSPAGSAPAPAPMASPAAAPEAAEEEEYNSHFTMDEDIGAQEQGFSGEVVEHNNGKTMTKDWRGEYGPGYDGMHSFVKICAMYPDNQWCRDRGYHRPTSPPKSAAPRLASGVALVATFGLFMLT